MDKGRRVVFDKGAGWPGGLRMGGLRMGGLRTGILRMGAQAKQQPQAYQTNSASVPHILSKVYIISN
jgi:hypothetical protein